MSLRGAPELVKKSPVVADENRQGLLDGSGMRSGFFIGGGVPVADRLPAVAVSWGTGVDIDAYWAIDVVFHIPDLPARHGNVRKYRQYNGQ